MRLYVCMCVCLSAVSSTDVRTIEEELNRREIGRDAANRLAGDLVVRLAVVFLVKVLVDERDRLEVGNELVLITARQRHCHAVARARDQLQLAVLHVGWVLDERVTDAYMVATRLVQRLCAAATASAVSRKLHGRSSTEKQHARTRRRTVVNALGRVAVVQTDRVQLDGAKRDRNQNNLQSADSARARERKISRHPITSSFAPPPRAAAAAHRPPPTATHRNNDPQAQARAADGNLRRDKRTSEARQRSKREFLRRHSPATRLGREPRVRHSLDTAPA